MDKWFKDILPDKDPYHNRGRDQMRKKGVRNSSACEVNRRSLARTTPLFLTFCLQIYFQYNFFISLLFHLFYLILTCSCQYSYNIMSTSNCMCRPYIDTNNTQGMQLGRFKNRSPARFEYIYCTLFPLCHSN
jgi:hypothetical protein